MGRPGRWWQRKSTPAKVETYTRWSFHSFALLEIVTVGLTALQHAGPRIAGLLILLVVGHAAVMLPTTARSLDWTRGRREQPVRLLWALAATTGVVAMAAAALAEHGPGGEGTSEAAGAAFGMVLCFGPGLIALGVRTRRRVCAMVAGFGAGAGLIALAWGMTATAAASTALIVLVGGGFVAFTSVFSVRLLNAVYALDEARETRARLAVAEERLRFGRDLHDVMGRNLAVIALKSELAVRLARRGRPEAVEQMIEVQRIAQESQREVRDVVRGYREADLEVEIMGARGVLTAAGIDCEVTGDPAGLPAGAQSALGWVVREATTNVLRHGDAKTCAVTVRRAEGRVVLTVENDGAPEPAAGPPGGSGLAGLRERLSAVDGTLEAGAIGKGVFRLRAEVPVGGAGAGGVGVGGRADDSSGAGEAWVTGGVAEARAGGGPARGATGAGGPAAGGAA
ncbi:sensor histidine kinase [Streptomyces tagetis]|uniref:Sensor histidine kinase n=1 Tax=Streptomyces tagetis TaxID=2820809 RepID=A0A941B7W7_9ACTN|nr:sensor histidine kinase [Streptomyces sp. RG38]MBQ0827893.1 sensor histidine kinase [Streptomyces sp. RG38]